MKKSTLAALIATVIAIPAMADGFYAGADLGRSKADISSPATKGLSLSKSTNSWGVFGGYQFHQNVAVEAAYRKLGDFDIAGSKFKSSALQTSVVGILPISPDFELNGRLGVAHLSAKEDHVKLSENRPLIGVGARYGVTKSIGLRADYTYYGKIKENNGKLNLSGMTVGADYRF